MRGNDFDAGKWIKTNFGGYNLELKMGKSPETIQRIRGFEEVCNNIQVDKKTMALARCLGAVNGSQ